MKKIIRKVFCLALVLCLMVPMASVAFAGSDVTQGSNFVAKNSTTTSNYTGDIGSSSSEKLVTGVSYYYKEKPTGIQKGGYIESSGYSYANVSGSSRYVIQYIIGSHTIGGRLVASMRVYP